MRKYLDGNMLYPYNEIRKTRNTMDCKWVLMHCDHGDTVHHPVVCKSFQEVPETLQKLMITKHALPLTPALTHCMDSMVKWGSRMDFDWHCDVVELIAFTITDGMPVDKKQIVSDCIETKMAGLVHQFCSANSANACLLMHEWKDFFERFWIAEGDMFVSLVVASEGFISNRISQLQAPTNPQPVLSRSA